MQLTTENIKDLLGTAQIPGSPDEQKILLHWAQALIDTRGEEYVRKYRRKLIRDWRIVLAIGLSRI